ncbi:MAG: GFA family protein [Gammaproteobacteria bacterium]|nr:GFA family protein [Gammaproteobacteria bacterium]
MNNPGRCLCGSVAWEITAEPFQAYNCHCKMCRKAHGAPFGTYWFLLPDQFRWTSDTDTIVHYRSSHLLTRSFCRTCGSVVPYPSERRGLVVAPAGCHDNGRKSDCEIFVAHKAPWFDITSDLPRHDDYPPESGYERVEHEPMPEGPEGVVRGSCLCGAIELHVTEPFRTVHNCHCSRCRRGRAAAHTSNGVTSMNGVKFIRGEEHLKSYKVPDAKFFTQVFCEICGSKMPRIDPDRQIAVTPLGILDDDPGMKPVDHIFVADMAGWHDITDDLPAFQQAPASRSPGPPRHDR